MSTPNRAHEFICKIGADDKDGLVRELHDLAERIARDELSVGVKGGSDVGSIYSYRHDPTMTHDRYFEEIGRILDAEKSAC